MKSVSETAARDGDAGFAALEATEPYFGSSELVTLFPLSLLPRRLRQVASRRSILRSRAPG